VFGPFVLFDNNNNNNNGYYYYYQKIRFLLVLHQS
jgi:hypothetical protein